MTTAYPEPSIFHQPPTPAWLARLELEPTPLAHKAKMSLSVTDDSLATRRQPTSTSDVASDDFAVEADQFLERVRSAGPTIPGSASPGQHNRQLLAAGPPAADHRAGGSMLMPVLVLFIIIASIVLALEFSGLLP